MPDMKQWKCRHGHILGFITRNGDRAPQLMVLRHAVDMEGEQPAEVDVMIGPLMGRMAVKCEICDDVQVWDITVKALVYLFQLMDDAQILEFSRKLLQMDSRYQIASMKEGD